MGKKKNINFSTKGDLYKYYLGQIKYGIKNYEVFTEDYVPNHLPCREDYLFELINYMTMKWDIMITGVPSSGKTVLIKRIFNELSFYDNDRKYIYINCRSKNKTIIFLEIIKSLSGIEHKIGWSISHYQDIINDLIEKNNIKRMYVCLDEYDIVACKYKPSEDMLYFFGNNGKYSVILIANTDDWYETTTDERSKARLKFKKILLLPYEEEEIKKILKERMKLGMENAEDFISDEEINYLINISIKHEDSLRFGILTLSKLINTKININRDLTKEEVESLFNNEVLTDKTLIYRKMPLKYKFFISILKQIEKDNKNTNFIQQPTISRILIYWNNNCDNIKLKVKSEKTIRRYASYLKEFGMITEKNIPKGRGRPSVAYYPNIEVL